MTICRRWGDRNHSYTSRYLSLSLLISLSLSLSLSYGSMAICRRWGHRISYLIENSKVASISLSPYLSSLSLSLSLIPPGDMQALIGFLYLSRMVQILSNISLSLSLSISLSLSLSLSLSQIPFLAISQALIGIHSSLKNGLKVISLSLSLSLLISLSLSLSLSYLHGDMQALIGSLSPYLL